MGDLKDLERRIKRIEEQLGIQNQPHYKFEELVEGLDRRTLEMIWTGIDTHNIAVSLIGLTAEQLKNVKGTFSKTRWMEITKEYQGPFMKEITESSISVNRGLVLEKILKLESMGEIVVSRGFDEEGEFLPLEEGKNKEPFVDVKEWVRFTIEKI